MLNSFKKELLYGGRALVRDNRWSQRLVQSLQRHERFDLTEMQQLRQRLLYRSLRAAMVKLPYYRSLSHDFQEEDACEVLRSFPIIDKRSLLDHPRELYPNDGIKRPWQSLGKTSGTTGTPLTVFRSPQSVLMEHAFIKRHWAWSGYSDGMPRATLRGDVVTSLNRRTPPFWFLNRYNNQLLLSSRHLLDDCIDPMLDRLEGFRPAMLQAYPSTAYALAQFLQRRNRRLRIPFLFCASEPLYPHQRDLIVERLGCQVMDMYGMAERVAFVTQCEFGAMHVNSDYAHVEIVDEDGQPTDGEGYVVGTTFHNLSMPLVRYRLSDQTRWKSGDCPCGRHFPMIEPVTGKLEDSITGSNGATVSASVLTFAFKGVEHIRKSQVAQVGEGHWEIRIVPDPGFGSADERLLRDNVRTLVDGQVRLDVKLVPELLNTAAGKFRWVVNEYRR